MIEIGMSDHISKTFTSQDVEAFARLSLDSNPLHLDDKFAAETIFKKRIVHGLLVSSLISAVLGNKLPGLGSIYLHQDLNFIKSVFLGDCITARVDVVEVLKPSIFKLKTVCTNQHAEVVVDGYAIIKKGS